MLLVDTECRPSSDCGLAEGLEALGTCEQERIELGKRDASPGGKYRVTEIGGMNETRWVGARQGKVRESGAQQAKERRSSIQRAAS